MCTPQVHPGTCTVSQPGIPGHLSNLSIIYQIVHHLGIPGQGSNTSIIPVYEAVSKVSRDAQQLYVQAVGHGCQD